MAPRRVIEATKTGNMLTVTQPGQTIADAEFIAFTDPTAPAGTGQGRGVVVAAPRTTVFNTRFVHGDDDALGLVGDCRGTLVSHCSFPVNDWRAGHAKALIAYTQPQSQGPGPIYGTADGYAGTFIRNDFGGGAIRLTDGVWRFEGGDITISHLYGIDMLDPCFANIVGVNFRNIPQPKDASYWGGVPIRLYRKVNGKYFKTSLKSRLYIANCTIDGRPATPQEICPGVPAYVFRKTPH